MPGSYTLPNPLSPATSDPLVSLTVRQNFQSLQAQINNADGAALQALSVQEAALSLNANPRLRATNAKQTYFVSGLNPVVPGSGLVLTIPAGVAYVNGYYVAYAGGTQTVTASQDTYLDISITGTITAAGVSNNTTAPALTANSARFAKVVANTNIVQVLQGTMNTAPVSPNTLHWFGFDTLGNPVYDTNPLITSGVGFPAGITTTGQSYTNPGSAAGTMYLVIAGGQRQLWGFTGALSTTGAAPQSVSGIVTFPLGFFTTIQAVLTQSGVASSSQYLYSGVAGITTSALTVNLQSTNGSNGAAAVYISVIGT